MDLRGYSPEEFERQFNPRAAVPDHQPKIDARVALSEQEVALRRKRRGEVGGIGIAIEQPLVERLLPSVIRRLRQVDALPYDLRRAPPMLAARRRRRHLRTRPAALLLWLLRCVGAPTVAALCGAGAAAPARARRTD